MKLNYILKLDIKKLETITQYLETPFLARGPQSSGASGCCREQLAPESVYTWVALVHVFSEPLRARTFLEGCWVSMRLSPSRIGAELNARDAVPRFQFWRIIGGRGRGRIQTTPLAAGIGLRDFRESNRIYTPSGPSNIIGGSGKLHLALVLLPQSSLLYASGHSGIPTEDPPYVDLTYSLGPLYASPTGQGAKS
uniref:Uncharacterized protein n=1 Tax=Glossina austeni TaxID=7395 RepID=A0A1A9VEF7_GLOAU